MKALLILVWAGGHSWQAETIWFTDVAACEKAKPAIVGELYNQFDPSWFSRNKAVCIEVKQ